ncbi:MAG: double zinc ribbon domain-containing protein [Desulfobacterales bacterium]
MKCSRCGTDVKPDQNYCGGCGRRLQNVCPACGSANPLAYNFCGQCGASLSAAGALTVDRAGIILRADPGALTLLEHRTGALEGKPFSLFVAHDDLVAFYTHWNRLIATSRPQNLKLTLHPSRKARIPARIDMQLAGGDGPVRLAISPPCERLRKADETHVKPHALRALPGLKRSPAESPAGSRSGATAVAPAAGSGNGSIGSPSGVEVSGSVRPSRAADGFRDGARQGLESTRTPPDPPQRPPMQFESDLSVNAFGRQRIFAGPDGIFEVICPICGEREKIAPSLFDDRGFAVRVRCGCGHRFSIMRELRKSFRKSVRLEGYFAQIHPASEADANGRLWGPMMVTNLSKSGLEFVSGKAGRLQAGERLSLRFYLDNSSRSLIIKTARIQSIAEQAVRCRFEGSDRYDVTLGFYFL